MLIMEAFVIGRKKADTSQGRIRCVKRGRAWIEGGQQGLGLNGLPTMAWFVLI